VLNGAVNRHKASVLGSENSNDVINQIRASSKINAFRTVTSSNVMQRLATRDDGQRNCPKHIEFHSTNKVEKLVHLVGFIIRNLATYMTFYPWLKKN